MFYWSSLTDYCRKDEFSVIIIGLDGAGKTVRDMFFSVMFTSYP